MVKNHKLAKSISDASWYQFCQWLGYYAKLHGIICVAVPPHFTSQDCSNCGARVEKTLSTRTHNCPHCHTVLDRDHNAAKNILAKGLKMLADTMKNTVGHTEINAQGESDRWFVNGDDGILSQLVERRTWCKPRIPHYTLRLRSGLVREYVNVLSGATAKLETTTAHGQSSV